MCPTPTSLPPVVSEKQDDECFSPRCAARRVSSKGFRYTETWLGTLAAVYKVPDPELAEALALAEELGAKQPDGLLFADPKAVARSRFLRCAAKALSSERAGKWTAGLYASSEWCKRASAPAWAEPPPEPETRPEPARPEPARPEPARPELARPESAGEPKSSPKALLPLARGTAARVKLLASKLSAAGVQVPTVHAVSKMGENHFLLRCGDSRVTLLDRTDSGGSLLVRTGGGFATLEAFWRGDLPAGQTGGAVRVLQGGKLTVRASRSLPPLRGAQRTAAEAGAGAGA